MSWLRLLRAIASACRPRGHLHHGSTTAASVRPSPSAVFPTTAWRGRTFPLHSPRLDKITVLRRGKVRRARLYYLRNLSGRPKIKEVIVLLRPPALRPTVFFTILYAPKHRTGAKRKGAGTGSLPGVRAAPMAERNERRCDAPALTRRRSTGIRPHGQSQARLADQLTRRCGRRALRRGFPAPAETDLARYGQKQAPSARAPAKRPIWPMSAETPA